MQGTTTFKYTHKTSQVHHTYEWDTPKPTIMDVQRKQGKTTFFQLPNNLAQTNPMKLLQTCLLQVLFPSLSHLGSTSCSIVPNPELCTITKLLVVLTVWLLLYAFLYALALRGVLLIYMSLVACLQIPSAQGGPKSHWVDLLIFDDLSTNKYVASGLPKSFRPVRLPHPLSDFELVEVVLSTQLFRPSAPKCANSFDVSSCTKETPSTCLSWSSCPKCV